jgi:hypothetical protein
MEQEENHENAHAVHSLETTWEIPGNLFGNAANENRDLGSAPIGSGGWRRNRYLAKAPGNSSAVNDQPVARRIHGRQWPDVRGGSSGQQFET